MENWTDLGRAVKFQREAAGMSQKALEAATAKDVGGKVSDKTIGKLERGGEVTPGTLQRIARAIGWDADTPLLILSGRLNVSASGQVTYPAPERIDRSERPPREVRIQPPGAHGVVQLSGNGSLTTASWGGGNREPTVREAREEIANLERDLGLALDDLEDVLVEAKASLQSGFQGPEIEDLIDQAIEITARIDNADRAVRWWRGHIEAVRLEETFGAARRAKEPTTAARRAEADVVIEMDPP